MSLWGDILHSGHSRHSAGCRCGRGDRRKEGRKEEEGTPEGVSSLLGSQPALKCPSRVACPIVWPVHTWRRRAHGLTCFSHLLKSQGLTATSKIHHRADLRGWGWNSDTGGKVGNDGGFDSFPFSAVIPKLVC